MARFEKPDRTSPSERDSGGPPEDDGFEPPDRDGPPEDSGSEGSRLDDVTPSPDPGLGGTGGPPEDDGSQFDRPDRRGPSERREQREVAREVEGITQDDIQRVADDGSVSLTDNARETIARNQFQQQREQARQTADIDDPTVSEVGGASVDELKFEATNSGVSIRTPGPTVDRSAEARARRQRTLGEAEASQQRDDRTIEDVEQQIRTAAAEDAPLREPEDFVVEAGGGVRRRARPFFEDQREALGLNPPEESSIRRRLRSGSRSVQGFFDDVATRQEQAVPSAGRLAQNSDVPGSDQIAPVTPADQTRGAGAVFDLPGAVDSAARVGERAANIGQASAESTAADLGLDDDIGADADAFEQEIDDQQAAVEQTASDIETVARNDPGVLVGAIGTGVATSVGVGVGVGRGVTRARDAARTAGATEVDFGDVTNPSTRAFVEGDEGDPFPPVQDRDLAADEPAAAIRQQSEEFTPEELETEFEDAGAPVGSDESVMFRAVDTEPEGPGRSRADQGLETFGTERPFDPPGGFVGPELSPRFLGVEDAEFSPRPGIPDFGGRPTGVAVRTRVREPDASDFEEFRAELDERAGETDAFTNPEFSMGEAEAVIPPQAEFTPVSSGGLGRRAARAVGVGSDFEVEVAGRSVPIRTVADVEGRRGFFADNRGSLGQGQAIGQSRRLDEFSSRAVRQRTDRPTGVPASSGALGTSSRVFGSSGVRLGLTSGASSSVSDGVTSGVSSPGSSGATGSSSSGASDVDGGAFAGGGSSSGTAGFSGFGGGSGSGTSGFGGSTGSGGLGTPTTASGGSGFGGSSSFTGDDSTTGNREDFEEELEASDDEGDILRDELADLFDSGIASADELLSRGSN